MTFHSLGIRGLATRRLRYALVASLLMHLLILWPGKLRVLTKDTPSPLQATLQMRPRPSPDPVLSSPPPRPVPPVQTRAPILAPPVLKLESAVLDQLRPSPVPQVTEPVAKPSPGPESAPAAAATPAPAGIAGGAGGSLMTEANASGEAVDGLRGYRLALATQARRFKRYPAQAMASGWTGSTDIRVEVGSDGRPLAAAVARSSGHDVLDRAALAMIDAGALRARLPESLRGKAFAVVLPVVFNLDDE